MHYKIYELICPFFTLGSAIANDIYGNSMALRKIAYQKSYGQQNYPFDKEDMMSTYFSLVRIDADSQTTIATVKLVEHDTCTHFSLPFPYLQILQNTPAALKIAEENISQNLMKKKKIGYFSSLAISNTKSASEKKLCKNFVALVNSRVLLEQVVDVAYAMGAAANKTHRFLETIGYQYLCEDEIIAKCVNWSGAKVQSCETPSQKALKDSDGITHLWTEREVIGSRDYLTTHDSLESREELL